MALIKKTDFELGYSGEYWRVSSVRMDKPKHSVIKMHVRLSLYRNAQDSAAGQPVLLTKSMSFNVTAQEVAAGNLIALAYEKIKAKNYPMLANAVDG